MAKQDCAAELIVRCFDARTQVVVRKLGPTPAGFPRRVGAAAREPIVRSEG